MAETQQPYSPAVMALLRANLGFYSTEIPAELDDYLQCLLAYAWDAFSAMDIYLTPGILADDMDQMTMAAWMYRNGPTGAGKTQQLKDIILNRQVRQALEAADDL